MKFRTFALALVAGLIVASGAGAVEYKHHSRAEDRKMSARSEPPGYWRNDSRVGAPDPLDRDPLTSANGS